MQANDKAYQRFTMCIKILFISTIHNPFTEKKHNMHNIISKFCWAFYHSSSLISAHGDSVKKNIFSIYGTNFLKFAQETKVSTIFRKSKIFPIFLPNPWDLTLLTLLNKILPGLVNVCVTTSRNKLHSHLTPAFPPAQIWTFCTFEKRLHKTET